MRADGEAVDLVAQALKVEQQRRIFGQHLFAAIGEVEYLAAFAPMVRALGDGDQRQVANSQFLERLFHR